MKHLLQIMVMFSDLLILAASIYLLYYTITNPSFYMVIVTIILLAMTYRTWVKQGAFLAWTKKGRANFSKNWDDIMRTKND